MVGWNYDGGGANKMTEEERAIFRSWGALALGVGGAYLLLTQKGPAKVLGTLTITGAGTHQEHGYGSVTAGTLDMAVEGLQNLGGHNLNSEIALWCIHNSSEEISAYIEAEFDDASKATVTLTEDSRTSLGNDLNDSRINLNPTANFEEHIITNGKSITKYTVTLNVSGKGKRLALQYTIGA